MNLKREYTVNFDNDFNYFSIKTDRLDTVEELEKFLTEVEEDKKTDIIDIETWLKYRVKELKNLDIFDIKVWDCIDIEDDEETAETTEILIQFEIGVLNTDNEYHYDLGRWVYERRIYFN